jgi:chromosome partitioning protein
MREYTLKQIIDLYKTQKTKTTLIRDETKGTIPKASRKERGSVSIRYWEEESLPALGGAYGFLTKPDSLKKISIYTPKGGVLKSTIAFNLARILAINNIKVLAIGLEVSQKTLTRNLCEEVEYSTIEEAETGQEYGLWDVVCGKVDLKSVIRPTSLETLNFIPETSGLNQLEQKIRDARRREYFLDELLKPIEQDYDVIIFDNSAFWGSHLVQCSLVTATDVITPFGCELESFRSVVDGVRLINDLKKDMKLDWGSFNIVPTQKNNTTLSTQIETHYRVNFKDLVTNTTISRLNAVAEESGIEQVSVIESHNKSTLSREYYDLVSELWSRINSPNHVRVFD